MIKITPQNNVIEFQLELQNLELKKTTPRLILEIGGKLVTVPLHMDRKGYCTGTIPILERFINKKGKVCVEVISENFYFKPYEQEVSFLR